MNRGEEHVAISLELVTLAGHIGSRFAERRPAAEPSPYALEDLPLAVLTGNALVARELGRIATALEEIRNELSNSSALG